VPSVLTYQYLDIFFPFMNTRPRKAFTFRATNEHDTASLLHNFLTKQKNPWELCNLLDRNQDIDRRTGHMLSA